MYRVRIWLCSLRTQGLGDSGRCLSICCCSCWLVCSRVPCLLAACFSSLTSNVGCILVRMLDTVLHGAKLTIGQRARLDNVFDFIEQQVLIAVCAARAYVHESAVTGFNRVSSGALLFPVSDVPTSLSRCCRLRQGFETARMVPSCRARSLRKHSTLWSSALHILLIQVRAVQRVARPMLLPALNRSLRDVMCPVQTGWSASSASQTCLPLLFCTP